MSMLTEWMQASNDERRAIIEAHNFGLSLDEYRNINIAALWWMYPDVQITILHGSDGKVHVSLGRDVRVNEWKKG